MSGLVGLLILLLVLVVVFWVLVLILDLLVSSTGLPAQIKPIALAIVGLIMLLVILRHLGYGIGL